MIKGDSKIRVKAFLNWLFYIIVNTCFSNVLNKNLELEMFHRLWARNISNFLLAKAATTATTVVADAVNTSVKVATGTNYVAKTEYSAFGEMSENDGVRYNQYWDDVAKGLDTNARVKLNQWEYRPSADLYNKYKSVYNNPKYFNQQTGNVNYPGTNYGRTVIYKI